MDESDDPIIFGEWLKRRRKSLDMTQDELARRAGCSVFAVRKIESGDRKPSKQLARLLADALEVPVEEQQTFLRVARGELNLGRLRPPRVEMSPSLSTISFQQEPPPVAAEAASPKSVASPSHRVPLQATPVIGRQSELSAMAKLFAEARCRLLTLTGMGGIGKTRLAIEFVRQQLPMFPGGVYFIPLAAVTTAEAIVPAIADALEMGFSGPADPKEQLLNYAASSLKLETLLVLDNLEHLLYEPSTIDHRGGLAELVSELLHRSPGLRILATSRERLSLHGEWTYELHGLAVPPADFAGQLEEYDAVALFIQCARRARADFSVEPEEQAALAKICQITQGIPLAIELAAAWTGILSCQEIAYEIQSNMDFLTTSMRDIPERHRSIRATFDHSWKLLSDEERQVLQKLSVFHGGFDRTAAMHIAGASLPLLAALGAKSLVRRTESGRFDLHEVIRQYAASHLATDPQHPGTYGRYFQFYLAFLCDRESLLKNASQQQTMRELTGEIDNIRAAWAWAVDHVEFTWLERAARGFGWYFEIAGLYKDGIEQLEPLVQTLQNRRHETRWHRLLGLALIQVALLAFRKGEFERARELYEESTSTLRSTGDQALLADSLIFTGTLMHLRGDYQRAKDLLEEGLVCARAGHVPWLEAYAICNLGYVDSLLGAYEEGYEQMMGALAIWRELGDPHSVALGLNFIVPTLNKLGRIQQARAFMQESIALCEQSKNHWGLGTAYRYMGLATMAGGQYDEAKTYFRKSLDVHQGSSIGWDIARTLAYLADVTMMSGELPEAQAHYLEALRVSLDASSIPIALDALHGLGELAERRGNAEDALRLYYHVLGHPSSEEKTRERVDRLRAELESTLSQEQIDAARIASQTKSFDSLVRELLEAV